MSIRKSLIVGIVGFHLGVAEALSKAGAKVVSVQIAAQTKNEEKLSVIRSPSFSYPSDRKSKGEKKRAASNRRRKGWA